MKDYIEERAVEIATYIIENNATVRQTAKQFGISKSTALNSNDQTQGCDRKITSRSADTGGKGAKSVGYEQIRASHTRWTGYKGKIFTPA